MAALVSASLCSSQGDADRFDSGVLGTHLLRGYFCGLTPVEAPSREDPYPKAPRPAQLTPPLGGEPLFAEDSAVDATTTARTETASQNPVSDDVVEKLKARFEGEVVARWESPWEIPRRARVRQDCRSVAGPRRRGWRASSGSTKALDAPSLILDGLVAQEVEPMARWEGGFTQGEAERIALWLGASLGVLHAAPPATCPSCASTPSRRGERTPRSRAASSRLRTGRANYAKQVEGLSVLGASSLLRRLETTHRSRNRGHSSVPASSSLGGSSATGAGVGAGVGAAPRIARTGAETRRAVPAP